MRARRGFLLAEALCALALSVVLAAAVGVSLAGARRAMGAAESRARARRNALEALQVTAALLRDADSVTVLGDTAVELSLAIADGVVCARDLAGVTLAPASTRASGLLASQPPEADDEVRALVRDTLGGARWVAAVVDSATTRTGSDACVTDGRYVAASDAALPRPRLVGSLDPRATPGTPVRVARRGRLSLYHAGGGDWMLGFRRCARGVCGTNQPVAGPLRTPSGGGFRILLAGPGAHRIVVRVAGAGAFSDSASMVVARTDAGR